MVGTNGQGFIWEEYQSPDQNKDTFQARSLEADAIALLPKKLSQGGEIDTAV